MYVCTDTRYTYILYAYVLYYACILKTLHSIYIYIILYYVGYGHGIYFCFFLRPAVIIIKAVEKPKIKRVWGSHYIML